ncbi:DUF309 domain-containing protein [Euhalothece natronophila Z-M001]|uniref:DUF309 domain-containing protein n=1 Tax=Euhalothece natronophila Z-M001 TaxID=522448 RepID=A0A5B8NL83_9CHRO|nr:DUF309 domain-containing protein [Euhalothece natronophila]QDZ40043.1 DUF309 domain-containing protein [Euhalothece natronophila Z-M001]
MPTATFWQGVTQFNQQQFYACHDTFEELWMEAELRDRAFYQGLLQIAVGCYHLSNLNWRGAVTLLGEGIGRLEEYEPTYFQIDVTQLLDQSSALLESLQDIGEENIEAWVNSIQAPSLPTIITVQGENYDSETE